MESLLKSGFTPYSDPAGPCCRTGIRECPEIAGKSFRTNCCQFPGSESLNLETAHKYL